ncbi:MAG TPA: hypothetical protein RMH99_15110 [Sandaracinaceae bacterium LLY-WYZ-13_1]|nr:hypothetical protein [Sandaracinaceae bacterium LLY-WYZ-13_1]
MFLSAGVWRSPGADAARAALVDLLREADALSLPTPAADAVGDVPTPPAAPSLVEADALAALGEGGELFVERSGAPTFVVQRSGDDEVAVTACALRAEGDDLRCSATRTVEGRASFRPLRRAAGAPVLVADLFARAGEDTATWDAFASEARGSFASPAFVRADGSLHGVVLRERGKPPHGIIRGPGATASTETPFDAPFRGAVPTDALAASGVVAVRWEDPGKRTGTTLHPVHADGLGPPRLLDGPGALRALCPLSVGALLVRDLGDRWRVDVIAGDADPVRHELEPTVASDTERVAVRCRGGAVHLLERGPPRPGADGRDRTPLRRSRCDAEGCASTEGAVVRPRLAENARLALLDRDDTMLAVWAGRGAPAVALAAPLASLGDATPRLVMDDARHGGLAVVEPMLLPHRDGALLLLRTDDAVHAVALDAEGRPRPARVTAR